MSVIHAIRTSWRNLQVEALREEFPEWEITHSRRAMWRLARGDLARHTFGSAANIRGELRALNFCFRVQMIQNPEKEEHKWSEDDEEQQQPMEEC